MTELHGAEIFNNIVIPVIAAAVTFFVIPWLRAKAQSEKDVNKKQTYEALAQKLQTVADLANVNVVQAEASADSGAAGVDKKQQAVKQTMEDAARLGISTQGMNIPAIIETAFSAKKQQLHQNYPTNTASPESSAVAEPEQDTSITETEYADVPKPLN
ncbi:phage holin, LLH family [Agrilactobacillus fermenti]|uniref:phage holin, LLH family n=1 Tax=Agrilactobacillus fermenti TaxID=2586909 RepID=UPI003A5BE65A